MLVFNGFELFWKFRNYGSIARILDTNPVPPLLVQGIIPTPPPGVRPVGFPPPPPSLPRVGDGVCQHLSGYTSVAPWRSGFWNSPTSILSEISPTSSVCYNLLNSVGPAWFFWKSKDNILTFQNASWQATTYVQQMPHKKYVLEMLSTMAAGLLCYRLQSE